MKLVIFFLFVLVLVLPSVTAIDCNSFSNKQWCYDIKNSDIPQEEKDYLLSDIISDSKNYPDHSIVKQWNNAISTTTPPEGITKKNSGYIKNAWVKILTVMPSVLFNDTLYISNQGEILSGFKHDLQIPSGTASGDCKTYRYLLEDTGTAKVYLNNLYTGNGHSVNYVNSLPDNADINILVKYMIQVKTKIKHYTLQKEYYWKNGKKRYRWVCNYDHTEYKTDKLTVTDSLKAKIHNPNPTASFIVKDKYSDTVKGEFISQDAVNVELNFYDSYYKEHNYVFSETASIKPLNVLTVKAEKQQSKENDNLVYSENEIVVPELDGCQIKVYDFFSSKIIPCNLIYQSPEFVVSTDKITYSQNEKIKVEIKPKRSGYVVTYNGKEYTTAGSLELNASYPFNKITVQYKDRVVPKLIHVKNDRPLSVIFSLFLFGMVNYTLVGLVRKYWGVALG
ncbi:MAG: hypothetical protein KJ984_03775 [Nanoarchaeota archaeon]|nr:hypothetical protein [Nanoarchaeota archaeon]